MNTEGNGEAAIVVPGPEKVCDQVVDGLDVEPTVDGGKPEPAPGM